MNFKCGAFLHQSIEPLFSKTNNEGKRKTILLQAWRGHDGSGRMRLTDFKTIGT
jgi:hypothetical protein